MFSGHTRLLKYLMYDIHMAKDRKSTRLNSSHSQISYPVFCLKKDYSGYSGWFRDLPKKSVSPRPGFIVSRHSRRTAFCPAHTSVRADRRADSDTTLGGLASERRSDDPDEPGFRAPPI